MLPERRGGDPGGETHAEALLRLAGAATLFHDPASRTYAAVPIDGHVEVHEIRSTGFRRWLKRLFYLEAAARRPRRRCRTPSGYSMPAPCTTAPRRRSSSGW